LQRKAAARHTFEFGCLAQGEASIFFDSATTAFGFGFYETIIELKVFAVQCRCLHYFEPWVRALGRFLNKPIEGSKMAKTPNFYLVAQSFAAVSLAFSISACSSKPGSSDISKALAQEFECPLLEISDVKKIDGTSRAEMGYEVLYSFQVNLKGGADAGVKLFPEWTSLGPQLQRAESETQRAMTSASRAPSHVVGTPVGDDPAVKRSIDNQEAIKLRLDNILACKKPNAYFALDRMRAATIGRLNAAQNAIPVVIALKMRGTTLMSKTENGWRFSQAPVFDLKSEEAVESAPVQIKSPFPPLTWSTYTSEENVFSAVVPSEGRCVIDSIDKATGKSWTKCSFATVDTDMDVHYSSRPSGTAGAEDIDGLLTEEMQAIAERNQETVVSSSNVQIDGAKGKDFVVTSNQGERSIRLIFSDAYKIEAIGTPKEGHPDVKAEREKFIKGVVARVVQ
jgi:hypothetical protein